MIRALAIALLAPAVALAADLDLGVKRIPMPEGDWTVIARRHWTGTMQEVLPGPAFSGVYAVEVKDGRWRRGVQAMSNTEPSWKGWRAVDDPCERRDTVLAYRDLSQNLQNQFCYDVTEVRGYMKAITPWRADGQKWLADHKVRLPESVLTVRFARIERHFWSEVLYHFDASDWPGDTLQEKTQALMKWAAQTAPVMRESLD